MTTLNGVAPDSVLTQLRELRTELQQERHIDLDVPGYKGVLRARYRPLSYERLRAITERSQKTTGTAAGKELALAADALVEACEAMLVRQDDGSYEPLEDDGIPVRYDHRLASALNISNPEGDGQTEPRMVLYETFGGLPNGADMRVVMHFQQFSEFQGMIESEVDESLVGESRGTE